MMRAADMTRDDWALVGWVLGTITAAAASLAAIVILFGVKY
jgi:hypothetical protein